MARTAREETATAAATGNSRAAAPPGVRLRARWVPFRAGVNALGVSLGGPRGHGAILRGKMRVFGVRLHRAPRVRTFRLPPPASSAPSSQQAAWPTRGARAPRGRAPCRHNSTSQQRYSCVLVSGFAAVGVRIPTGDRENSHAPLPWRSRLAHSARLVEAKCALCVWFLICTRPQPQKRHFLPEFGYPSCTTRVPDTPPSEKTRARTTPAFLHHQGAAGVRSVIKLCI